MNKKILVGISAVCLTAVFWACGDGDVITRSGDDELALLNYGPPFAEGDEGNMKTLMNQAMTDCSADKECSAKMEGSTYTPPESSADGDSSKTTPDGGNTTPSGDNNTPNTNNNPNNNSSNTTPSSSPSTNSNSSNLPASSNANTTPSSSSVQQQQIPSSSSVQQQQTPSSSSQQQTQPSSASQSSASSGDDGKITPPYNGTPAIAAGKTYYINMAYHGWVNNVEGDYTHKKLCVGTNNICKVKINGTEEEVKYYTCFDNSKDVVEFENPNSCEVSSIQGNDN